MGWYQRRVHGTDDGFDGTMEINHLSSALLTELLLPALHKSAQPRVVYLGSANMYDQVVEWNQNSVVQQATAQLRNASTTTELTTECFTTRWRNSSLSIMLLSKLDAIRSSLCSLSILGWVVLMLGITRSMRHTALQVSSIQFSSGLVHSTLNRLCPAPSLLQHNQGLRLPLELSLILPPTSPRKWELFKVVKHAFLDPATRTILCHHFTPF